MKHAAEWKRKSLVESADFGPFSKMMELVAEQYGKPMSPELLRFYFEGLAHLPLVTVREAMNLHVRDKTVGQFMPKIADIVRAATVSDEALALAALERVQRDFTGASCDDPTIEAAVRSMGGWRALGQRDADEWARFGATEFMRRYLIYRGRESNPLLGNAVAGLLEDA
jgi:hypothetical protein